MKALCKDQIKHQSINPVFTKEQLDSVFKTLDHLSLIYIHKTGIVFETIQNMLGRNFLIRL